VRKGFAAELKKTRWGLKWGLGGLLISIRKKTEKLNEENESHKYENNENLEKLLLDRGRDSTWGFGLPAGAGAI
jgi:hypothetical protein